MGDKNGGKTIQTQIQLGLKIHLRLPLKVSESKSQMGPCKFTPDPYFASIVSYNPPKQYLCVDDSTFAKKGKYIYTEK